jgi:hypothetical protein
MTPEIFDGGESPLAAKATTAAANLIHGQTGATQSDGGAAPSPGLPSEPGAAATSGGEIGEPPQGGVVRARKS